MGPKIRTLGGHASSMSGEVPLGSDLDVQVSLQCMFRENPYALFEILQGET